MRVAVVSDIHGSLTALEAIVTDLERRAPDAVVHGGDLVLMGPQPAEVVDRLRELGWPGVVGNTDELLWRPECRDEQLRNAPQLRRVIELLFDDYAPATLEHLDGERLAWLRGLPAELRLGDLVVVHAAPRNLWRAPMPEASDDEVEEVYAPLEAGHVVYGHIHRPYVRALDSMVVANSGSASMPWDGDPRASYLLVDDGEASVVRVVYDVERDAELLTRSGHPDAERIVGMRRTGRFVAPSPARA
jgi:putative phosphoesterase